MGCKARSCTVDASTNFNSQFPKQKILENYWNLLRYLKSIGDLNLSFSSNVYKLQTFVDNVAACTSITQHIFILFVSYVLFRLAVADI